MHLSITIIHPTFRQYNSKTWQHIDLKPLHVEIRGSLWVLADYDFLCSGESDKCDADCDEPLYVATVCDPDPVFRQIRSHVDLRILSLFKKITLG